MSDEEVKTCVSCAKFGGQDAEPYPNGFLQQQAQQGPECRHPLAVTRDMVYGKAYCRAERNDKKGCGPKGRLWVSKTNEKNA